MKKFTKFLEIIGIILLVLLIGLAVYKNSYQNCTPCGNYSVKIIPKYFLLGDSPLPQLSEYYGCDTSLTPKDCTIDLSIFVDGFIVAIGLIALGEYYKRKRNENFPQN